MKKSIEDRIKAAKIHIQMEWAVISTASALFFKTLYNATNSILKATYQLVLLCVLSVLWVPVAAVEKALK